MVLFSAPLAILRYDCAMPRGIVVLYINELSSGFIRSYEGSTYRFDKGSWQGTERLPQKNDEVTFELDGEDVRSVRLVTWCDMNS